MEVASEVVDQGLDLWVAGEKVVQQAEGVAGVGWIDGTEWDGLGLTEVDFDDLNVRALFVLLAVGLVARKIGAKPVAEFLLPACGAFEGNQDHRKVEL